MKVDIRKRIHPIPLPTPFSGVDINAYLIEGSFPTLIDTGARSSKSMKALETGLSNLGLKIEDIRRVILTHGHLDHAGNAFDICDQAMASLLTHTATPRQIQRKREEEIRMKQFLIKCGVPPDLVSQMFNAKCMSDKFSPRGDLPAISKLLKNGDTIPLDDFSLTVVHTPGHCLDHICLVDRVSGITFTGDHLLPDITPKPLIYFNPDKNYKRMSSLVDYLKSLDRLEKMNPGIGFPGHGPVIENLDYLIKANRKFIHLRKEEFRKHFEQIGKATIYDIARSHFGELDAVNTYMAVSETVAYKDLLNRERVICLGN